MTEIQELLRVVENGAELLDNSLGQDWAERIDIERLDVMDASQCILGQLFGDPTHYRSGYSIGLEHLELDCWADEDEEHGFVTASSVTSTGIEWEFLRQLWIFQIVIRTAE